jgi:DNA ligase (NAD+)
LANVCELREYMNITASQFLKKLKQINFDELDKIKGIGRVLADNLKDFIDSERYSNLTSKFQVLENKGIILNIKQVPTIMANSQLSNEKICITGTFEISRDKIKEQLEELGAKIVTDVSKNTTILLCGQDAGSKLEKAKKLKIKIVTDLTELDIKLD